MRGPLSHRPVLRAGSFGWVVAIAAAIVSPAGSAHAATFNVTSTADVAGSVCAAPCSLRQAIGAANANGASPVDTIILPAGTYALTLAGAGDNANLTGDLDVTQSVEILGAGAGGTIIQGAPTPSERVFETLAGTDVSISNVSITGSNDPAAVSAVVSNGASLTLASAVVSGNSGRGIVAAFAGNLTLTGTTISGNSASRSVVEAFSNGAQRVAFTNSSISGNTVASGSGFPAVVDLDNGINNTDVRIAGTTFSGNTGATQGVIDFNPSGGANAAGDRLSITDSVFSGNQLGGGIGAIQFDPSAGGGNTTPMSLSIDRTRFENNVAGTLGSGSGGAVGFYASGGAGDLLAISDSAFQGNVAGGAAAGQGGAIDFGTGDPGASMAVTGSTFAGNKAGSSGTGSDGGAISFKPSLATLSITNSTFSGNSVTDPGPGKGGGAITYEPSAGSQATLTNLTVAGNSVGASGEGGGIRLGQTVKPTVRNTILHGNTDAGAVSDCSALVLSGGGNIEGGTTCGLTGNGDRRSTDPRLGPLATNGGPTQTHALLTDSPAINRGLAAFCPATDQRGVSRPQLGACDIGAFELAPAAAPPAANYLTAPNLVPVLGKLVRVQVLSGKVFLSLPPGAARVALLVPGLKGKRFTRLRGARLIPVGSFLDTRKGKVRLTSARDTIGKTQSGDFSAGVFQVLQSGKASAKGLTELRLKGASFKRCRRVRKAEVRPSRRSGPTVRRVRSKAKGRFRTRGRYSAATVRGTEWTVTDRCDGTLTTVKRGTVAVRDFRRKRTILVRTGKRYLAKAAR